MLLVSVPAAYDRTQPGNGYRYLSGMGCMGGFPNREDHCAHRAGTAWSTLWCFCCNVVRMQRIHGSLSSLFDADGDDPTPATHDPLNVEWCQSDGRLHTTADAPMAGTVPLL